MKYELDKMLAGVKSTPPGSAKSELENMYDDICGSKSVEVNECLKGIVYYEMGGASA